MNEKALYTLEYDKILLRLEALAGSEGAKAMCRELRPMTEREEIAKALAETTDAAARLSAKGSIAFGGIADVRASVKRAGSGSSLSIVELLRVMKILQMADRAKVYGKTDRDTPPDALTERFEGLEPADPCAASWKPTSSPRRRSPTARAPASPKRGASSAPFPTASTTS